MTDAIELACERATEDDFAAMDENIETLRKCLEEGNYEGQVKAVTHFYEVIASASKNKVMVATIVALTRTLSQFYGDGSNPSSFAASLQPKLNLVESRLKILKYLRQRKSGKAAQEMVLHLTGLHHYLLHKAKSSSGTSLSVASDDREAPTAIRRTKRRLGGSA